MAKRFERKTDTQSVVREKQSIAREQHIICDLPHNINHITLLSFFLLFCNFIERIKTIKSAEIKMVLTWFMDFDGASHRLACNGGEGKQSKFSKLIFIVISIFFSRSYSGLH